MRERVGLLLVLLAAAAGAQTKVGTTAGAFLQIGVGGRGAAMGETAVASAADVSAIYWNPALAATLNRGQAYFNHTTWFADIAVNYGAVMLHFDDLGQFALSFCSLNSGQLEITTEEREEGTGELFTVQDLMLGLTYSRGLTDRFNFGGTVKLIRQALWDMSATTVGLDVGLTYRTPFNPVTIGMSISNFGGEMRLSGTNTAVRYDPDPRVGGNNDGIVADIRTRSWDLPVTFRAGFAYRVLETRLNRVLLSGDLLYPNNNDNYLNLGAEYSLNNMFFLRAGYRQLMLADAEGGLAAGVGFNYRNVRIDFAHTDRGRLNSPQYFSVGVDF